MRPLLAVIEDHNMAIQHSVFVIMPYASEQHTDRVYTNGIEPAMVELKLTPVRVDREAISDSIGARIRSQIASSYFCIADLSCERPNCYYEVGYAHALGKRVLFIKDSESKAHFDLSDYQYNSFDQSTNLKELLLQRIPEFLASPRREDEDTNNQYFGRVPIRDGFRLMAKVTTFRGGRFYFDAEVISLQTERPLKGKVRFHLHEYYKKSVHTISARKGRAVLEDISTDGPYTLGATIEKTGTCLELDLATIPCHYEKWRKAAYKIVDGLVL